MQISKKWLAIGAAFSLGGLFTFVSLEVSIFGGLIKTDKLTLDWHQEHVVLGPNMDAVKAFETLRLSVERIMAEHNAGLEALAKVKKDTEEKVAEKTAAIQDMERTKADVAGQKTKLAEELTKDKQDLSDWKVTARKQIADIQAEFATAKSERDAAVAERDKARREIEQIKKGSSAQMQPRVNSAPPIRNDRREVGTFTKPPTAVTNSDISEDSIGLPMLIAIVIALAVVVGIINALFNAGGKTPSAQKPETRRSTFTSSGPGGVAQG